jgi:hypothetical protein
MILSRAMFSYCFLLLTITACQANKERSRLGKSYAKKELLSVLAGEIQHNVVDNKALILKDSMNAVSVCEPILFSIYGKDNIMQQRPYEAYLVDNYWIIFGTLPKDYSGGTFLVILNAKDGKILRITHGK